MGEFPHQKGMTMAPLLQLALDYIELEPALEMARLVRDEVDIIELGTPLVKAEGMRAVRAIREACPDNLILADMKTPDVGALVLRRQRLAAAQQRIAAQCDDDQHGVSSRSSRRAPP